MLPDFGVGMRQYLFETEAEFIIDEIRDRIFDQVRFYMNYIKIEDVFCTQAPKSDGDNEAHQLNVSVTYSIPFLNVKGNVTVSG